MILARKVQTYVENEDNARGLWVVVPGFVLERVVKNNTFPLFEFSDFVADPKTAVPPRNDQRQVATEFFVRGSVVFGYVGAWGQCAEKCVVVLASDGLNGIARKRTLVSVIGSVEIVQEQVKHVPVSDIRNKLGVPESCTFEHKNVSHQSPESWLTLPIPSLAVAAEAERGALYGWNAFLPRRDRSSALIAGAAASRASTHGSWVVSQNGDDFSPGTRPGHPRCHPDMPDGRMRAPLSWFKSQGRTRSKVP